MSLWKSPAPSPTEDEIANGAKYITSMPGNGRSIYTKSGDVYDEAGKLCWSWRYLRWSGAGYTCSARPWRPIFVIETPDGEMQFQIRRSAFFPSAFQIIGGAGPVGEIVLRSPLRNRYQIRFNDDSVWRFHFPMFTVRFYCASDLGGRVWGMIGPSELQWNFLLAPGTEDPKIVAVMAFLHSRRM